MYNISNEMITVGKVVEKEKKQPNLNLCSLEMSMKLFASNCYAPVKDLGDDNCK